MTSNRDPHATPRLFALEGGALIIGEPTESHARVTREAVVVTLGCDTSETIAWSRVHSLTVVVRTRFRRSCGRVIAWICGLVDMILGGSAGVANPECDLVVATAAGEDRFTLTRAPGIADLESAVIEVNELLARLGDPQQRRTLLVG